jgi:hypothetical protein
VLVLFFVLFVNCGWILQLKNSFKVNFSSAAIFYWPFSSVIDRNRNRPFNLIQNKVGYRSGFATGVKLEQFLWNSFSFWLLVLFSVLFVNCGDNIKVYFSIVTHEIPLRVRKKPRRTQCTIRSAVNHLQNLFNIKTVS